ncbi:hypothetical protein WJX73_008429 [Symbiochloris irregularis]|uniref:Uncharacterized protein n=1 Tax=Symbiochloris irregularis TaxID=706552 RepID=A0AAW1PPH0_9CHLO
MSSAASSVRPQQEAPALESHVRTGKQQLPRKRKRKSEPLHAMVDDVAEQEVAWSSAVSKFQPGEVWYDTEGRTIQAHGGGILYHQGLYYWYGENKAGPTYMSFNLGYSTARVDIIGISCYSSPDLIHWTHEGPALRGGGHADLQPRRVAERPKVIYHDETRRFVMWLHMDTEDYELARAGVAWSKSPTGPFWYQGSFRPHGQQARDLTVYKDDDGSAYLVYTSEDNRALHIAQLTEDYLGVRPGYTRAMVNLKREAPAVFKSAGLYFMMTSGCTGWDPNSAEVFYSKSMMGSDWLPLGNPCMGATEVERTFTFFSQPTFVLPLPNQPGRFIFMADQWDSENLSASRYLWLPMWVLPVPLPVQQVAARQYEAYSAGGVKTMGRQPVLPPSAVDVVVQWESMWQLQDLQDPPLTRYESQAGGQTVLAEAIVQSFS